MGRSSGVSRWTFDPRLVNLQRMSGQTFQGFSPAALTFYAGLEADNSKDYWTAHRQVFEAEVRDPMRALAAELEPEFGPVKLFRPNRDIRFSQDKSPYKTYLAGLAGTHAGIGYYVELSARGLTAGGGFHSHGSDQVDRFRRAVDDDRRGEQLRAIVSSLEKAGYEIERDPLKIRPRGYPAGHPRIELLRCRSLTAFTRFGTPGWLSKPRAADEVRAAWREVRPLSEWIVDNVSSA